MSGPGPNRWVDGVECAPEGCIVGVPWRASGSARRSPLSGTRRRGGWMCRWGKHDTEASQQARTEDEMRSWPKGVVEPSGKTYISVPKKQTSH